MSDDRCYILHNGFWYGSQNGCYASLGGAVLCNEGDRALPPASVDYGDFTFIPYDHAPDSVRDCIDPAYRNPADPDPAAAWNAARKAVVKGGA